MTKNIIHHITNPTNRFLIYGLGITGSSAARFLAARHYCVEVMDDNITSLAKFIANNPKVQNFSNNTYDYIVLSPGIDASQNSTITNLVVKGAIVISDIDVLKAFDPHKIFIGITGTNGKSTTSSLISFLLNKLGWVNYLGGNIGKSLLDEDCFGLANYVIEVSSYQSEMIHFGFNYALLTNISQNHIERHGTMKNYIEAKVKLLKNAKHVFIGIDDELSKQIFHDINCAEKVSFSMQNKPKNLPIFKNLPGEHNIQNILGALSIVRAVLPKISGDRILELTHEFKGLPHRIEFVRTIKNLTFVNDSKATNVRSAEMSIKALDNIYLICGGKIKDIGIEYFFNKEFFSQKVLSILLIGETTEDFYAKCVSAGMPNVYKCFTIENAVNKAYEDGMNLGMDINVLLAPMCQSFDQFKNFEHRGEEFKKIVNSI